MAPPLRLPLSNGFLCRLFGQRQYFRNRSAFFQRLFLRLFLLMLQFDGLLFWTFFSMPEDLAQFALHVPFNFSLPQDFLDVIFFSCPCLLFRTPEDFLFYDQPEAVLFFPVPEEDLWCLKKTHDAWRSVAKLSTREDMVFDVDTKSPA